MTGRKITVGEIAYARSGDKGADSNVGVWASNRADYQLLKEHLSEDVVKAHFGAICRGAVTRYELPNLHALNFVLHDSLDGGGTTSLRSDAQGKAHGNALLFLEIEVPPVTA